MNGSKLFRWIAMPSATIVGLLLLLISAGAVRIYHIPTGSMTPTVQPGDRIICVSTLKAADKLPRNSLIVYEASQVSRKLNGNFLGRMVALPGDRIDVVAGILRINDGMIPIRAGESPKPARMAVPDASFSIQYPYTVPPGHVFVIGDNYPNSLDSRYFGPVPVDAVKKQPWLRIIPFSRFGRIE
jgi:signal peptidase I